LLDINKNDNFTDYLHRIELMNLYRKDWLIVTVSFLFLMVCFSCSSHSREAMCKGNNTYRSYQAKKNKSRYNQKYVYKNKSVKKDYVIKNGIAR
jgi:hypothetical protein